MNPMNERLIVALDMSDVEHAYKLVTSLDDSVSFYKLGLSLIFDREFWYLFDWLKSRDCKVFADVKLFDIPDTVEASVARLAGSGASFVTVHAHEKMIEAAIKGRGVDASLKILAVTALTSLDERDLQSMGFPAIAVQKLVLDRARRMLAAGCDGLISSGLEVASLRQEHADGCVLVVPGIRPVVNDDDQKRTVDVETAFAEGADYIVVGRPIRMAPDPRAAAMEFQRRIAACFE